MDILQNIYNTYNTQQSDNTPIDIEFTFTPLNNSSNINTFVSQLFNNTPDNNTEEDVKVVMKEGADKDLNYIEYKNITEEYCKDNNLILSEECNICLSKFEGDDIVLHTSCNHLFHKDCMYKWLKEYSIKCPICKIELVDGEPQL